MGSPRKGSLGRSRDGRRLAAWTALALGWVLPSTGCQVEYAGMTLPSGKFLHDDVQYFPPGPDFPWANTQAATQRARMQQMGMEVPPLGPGGPVNVPVAEGALPGVQNQMGRPTDTNASPMAVETPLPGERVNVPPPGAGTVPPGAGEAVTPPGAGDMGPR